MFTIKHIKKNCNRQVSKKEKVFLYGYIWHIYGPTSPTKSKIKSNLTRVFPSASHPTSVSARRRSCDRWRFSGASSSPPDGASGTPPRNAPFESRRPGYVGTATEQNTHHRNSRMG